MREIVVKKLPPNGCTNIIPLIVIVGQGQMKMIDC